MESESAWFYWRTSEDVIDYIRAKASHEKRPLTIDENREVIYFHDLAIRAQRRYLVLHALE